MHFLSFPHRFLRAMRMSSLASLGTKPSLGASRPVVRCRATGGETSEKKKQKKESLKYNGPSYRVLLHNDQNKREYVIRVLLKVVDELTFDRAQDVMMEAHLSGLAMVTASPQQKAEIYCQGLRGHGLSSTIEPE